MLCPPLETGVVCVGPSRQRKNTTRWIELVRHAAKSSDTVNPICMLKMRQDSSIIEICAEHIIWVGNLRVTIVLSCAALRLNQSPDTLSKLAINNVRMFYP